MSFQSACVSAAVTMTTPNMLVTTMSTSLLDKYVGYMTLDEMLTLIQKTYDIIGHLQKTGHSPTLDSNAVETLKVLFRCRNIIYISGAVLRLLYRYVVDLYLKYKKTNPELARRTGDPLSKPLAELTIGEITDIIERAEQATTFLHERVKSSPLLPHVVPLFHEMLRYNDLLPITKLALAFLIEFLAKEIRGGCSG